MMLHVLLDSTLRATLVGALVWVGLKALRTRSPALQGIAWTMVLLASLSMPMLDDIARLVAPARLALVTMRDPSVPLLGIAQPIFVPNPVSAWVSGGAPGPQGVGTLVIRWADVLSVSYLLVAGILLLRLLIGIALTWRLRAEARPVDATWAQGADMRTSPAIKVPVTFGSTILLPEGAATWGGLKRAAVLSHERAHIERGDFYVQLLAGLNRAVFWFNPFAWWLAARLAALAEAACDDAAVAALGERVPYAEILLDVAKDLGRVPAGVAMARPGLVGSRIERILAMASLPAQLTRRKRMLAVLSLVPLIVAAAVAIADPSGAGDPKQVAVDPKIFDRYVGYYEYDPKKAPNMVVMVTRVGDHLFVEMHQHLKTELFPESAKLYFQKGTDGKVEFIQQGDEPATALKLIQAHPDGKGGVAKRVDEAEMKRADAEIEKNKIEQAKPRVEAQVDPKIFDRYVGQYRYGPLLFTVTHEADYLFVKLGAQVKLRVFPENDHEFFYKIVPAQITFVTDGAGPATTLILHQNGMDMPAPRTDAVVARELEADFAKRLADEDKPRTAVAIDPKILDDYVGHYQLTPEYVFTVSRQGDQLLVQLANQPAFEVYPENDHEFFYTVVKAQVSFIRDDKGRPTELVLHQNGQNQVAIRTD